MTSQEYWTEVEEVAAAALQSAREYGSDLGDQVWEGVDGHAWVIYTHHAAHILNWSDNADAVFEWGGLGDCESWAQAMTAMASNAFMQDVQEKASELECEADAEREAAEERATEEAMDTARGL